MTAPTIPNRLHVLAKPTGSTCNLNCAYCFYLKKEALYPVSLRQRHQLQEMPWPARKQQRRQSGFNPRAPFLNRGGK
jgi:uncharacterized protein